MPMHPRYPLVALLLCTQLSQLACGGADDSGGVIGETISAAEGGTVEVDAAMIDIPAAALDEDTEITVEVVSKAGLPEAGDIASLVYELGPDGLTFAVPVTLTIAFDASETPEGKHAVLAFLNDADEWTQLPNSQVDGDIATATTTHFTKFAVIWVARPQIGGSCDDLEFEACGGDPVGHWEFTLACGTSALADDDPLATCGSASLALDIDLTGTLVFDEDATYEQSSDSVEEITLAYPKACLEEDMTCGELSEAGEAPFEDVGDACEQVQIDTSTRMDTGTWSADGASLVRTPQGGAAEDAVEFCVQGDVLSVRYTGTDGGSVVYRAARM